MLSQAGESRSRPEARQRIRETLFADMAPQRSNDAVTSLVQPVHAALERQSSRRVRPSQALDASLNVESVLAILQELKKTATTQDLVALQSALQPAAHSDPAPMSFAPEISPTQQENTTPMTVRRRSLFAATREPKQASAKLLRKSPPSKTTSGKKRNAQTWSPEMFVASPLSKLASIPSLTADGPRSGTPVGTEVIQLGSHSLGSLHITNGAATPEPSIFSAPDAQLSRSSLFEREDYFTASEDADNASTATLSRPSTAETWKPHQDSADSLHKRLSPTTIRSPPIPPRSPLGPRRQLLKRALTANSLSSTNSDASHSQSPLSLYSAEASSNPFLPDILQAPAEKNVLDISRFVTTKQGQTLRSSMICQPDFDTESIYSDRPGSQYSNWPVQDARMHAYDKLGGVSHESPNYNEDHASDQSLLVSRNKALNESPETRSDSGYSSNDALPAFDVDVKDQALPSTYQLDSASKSDIVSLQATPTTRVESGLSQDRLLNYQRYPRIASPLERPHVRDAQITSIAYDAVSSPVIESVDACKVDGSSASSPILKAKKLQKKRPSSERSKTAPIKLCIHDSLANVPSPPIQVVAKHSERLKSYPEMQHLERTFDSISICDDREECNNVDLLSNIEIRFPSPETIQDDVVLSKRGRGVRRKSYSPHSRARQFFSSSSRSRKERSSSVESQNDKTAADPIGIADFGTVAHSLGSSPYDIASINRQPQVQKPGSVRHPHQLSNRMIRSKSMFGMDEKAASEFALQRSRDRLVNISNEEAYDRSFDSAMHNGSSIKRTRPTSVHSPPPPVPAIPQLRAMRRRSTNGPMEHDEVAWKVEDQSSGLYRSSKSFNDQSCNILGDRAGGVREPSSSPHEEKQEQAGDDWYQQAAFWREQRKVLSEGLRQVSLESDTAGSMTSEQLETVTARNTAMNRALQTADASLDRYQARTSVPGTHGTMSDSLQASETVGRQMEGRPLLMSPALSRVTSEVSSRMEQSRSPSPSVRERAAFFERATIDESSTASPSPSRTPSPTKQGDSRAMTSPWPLATTTGNRLPFLAPRLLPHERKPTYTTVTY